MEHQKTEMQYLKDDFRLMLSEGKALQKSDAHPIQPPSNFRPHQKQPRIHRKSPSTSNARSQSNPHK